MYGQICEANGKNESAWTSFRDAIEVLRPQFYAVPAAFVPLMGALVRNYFGICKKLNREPDAKSLAPILEILRSASDVK